VILAAGQGQRLNGFNPDNLPKPLVPVAGVPMITRAVHTLQDVGVTEIIVVVGYRADEIRQALASETGVRFVENPRWELNAGLSLLAAREAVANRPFFLTMADHVFSPDVLIGLQSFKPNGHSYLAIDTHISRVFGLESQIKVRLEGEHVVALGRSLDEADAVDTRVALLSPAVFDALAQFENPRVTDGFRILADERRIKGIDIGGAFWQDIDTPETLRHAEWLLSNFGEDLKLTPRQTWPSRSINNPERTLAYVNGILDEKEPNHYVLFNPGPVVTSARVKSALVHHDVCHRDEGFSVLMARLRRKLKRVFRGGPDHEVLLITGSGTSGMEAAISSTIPRDKKLLVVDNGAFGNRFHEIAELHGIQHTVLHYAWGELVQPADLEAALVADPEIFAVVMTHHETSVGILNPVREVGTICRRLGRLFIVDTVASLGGEDVDVERDMIDLCISSANKCLHGIAGVAMACVHRRVWDLIEDVPPRVYYLDLKRYRKYEVEIEQTPFTPAVSNFYALDAAVDELLARGVEHRIATYRRRNDWIRREFRAMGFGFFTETGTESHTILTVGVPEGIVFQDMYDAMKRLGFIIYGCKESLTGKFFQVANMGELTDDQITAFLGAFRMVMHRLRLEARRTARPAFRPEAIPVASPVERSSSAQRIG
jgi:2-aminoethylphosphonate-pyruvate transaminase